MKTSSPSALPLISPSSSLGALCYRCQSLLTPVCPSLSSRCPVSFSAGWSRLFFWRLVYGGKEYPAAPGRLRSYSSSQRTWQPPSLWCRVEPRGKSKIFQFSLFFLNFTSDGWSILCAPANSTCFGPCALTLCNFCSDVIRGYVPIQDSRSKCFIECNVFPNQTRLELSEKTSQNLRKGNSVRENQTCKIYLICCYISISTVQYNTNVITSVWHM